jgi:tRNA/rRNA methyltransferase
LTKRRKREFTVETALLNHISIVLVEPQHPGNIGAVGRAMKNMGLSTLILVSPLADPRSAEALHMAIRGADILEQCQVVSSLEEAIAPVSLVVGTSVRPGRTRYPVYTPRAAVPHILSVAQHNQVAIVFGPERSGLTNTQLDLCHFLVRIPSSEQFPSLNLAQAVMILCYELYYACSAESYSFSPRGELAPTAKVERMYGELKALLLKVGFLDPNNPERIMRALRRLFGRTGLTAREVSIFRGIIDQIEWYSERRHHRTPMTSDLRKENSPCIETTPEHHNP